MGSKGKGLESIVKDGGMSGKYGISSADCGKEGLEAITILCVSFCSSACKSSCSTSCNSSCSSSCGSSCSSSCSSSCWSLCSGGGAADMEAINSEEDIIL